MLLKVGEARSGARGDIQGDIGVLFHYHLRQA
jgi:hypothetical protein